MFFVNKDHSDIAGDSYSVLHRYSIGTSDYTRTKIGMSKVSARWVPKQLKQLTEDKKKNKFLNCIVTGDEMWVHYAEPKNKSSVKAVETSWFPTPKKFKLSPSAGKLMLIAYWDSCGITLAHSMPKGRNMAARYYSEVILKKKKKKKKKLKKKKKTTEKSVIFCMTMLPLILPHLQ